MRTPRGNGRPALRVDQGRAHHDRLDIEAGARKRRSLQKGGRPEAYPESRRGIAGDRRAGTACTSAEHRAPGCSEDRCPGSITFNHIDGDALARTKCRAAVAAR